MPENLKEHDLGRRGFVAASVAAGLATAASVSAKELEVVETDVEIKTPDGTCDAAFIHPKTGSHAGVLLWPDAFGLRPVTRAMGKRLAAEGYSVLVPNPFYRVSKAPFTDASNFNFQNADDMAKLRPLMASVTAANRCSFRLSGRSTASSSASWTSATSSGSTGASSMSRAMASRVRWRSWRR